MQIRTWTRLALLAILTAPIGCEEGKTDKLSEPAAAKAPAAAPEAQAQAPDGWVTLAPAGLGFSVAMPVQPQSRKDQRKTEQGTIDTTIWMAVTPTGAAYSLGVADMPAPVAEVLTPKTEFDDVRNKLLVKVGGELIAEKNEEMDGHYARTFSLFGQGPKGESLIRVRLVRVGSRTFQLMTVHAKQEDMNADAKAFFQSFALSKR